MERFETLDSLGGVACTGDKVKTNTGSYLQFNNILLGQVFRVDTTGFTEGQIEAAYITLMDIGPQVQDMITG